MAMNNLYGNQLNDMLTGANGGYQGTPGFKFAQQMGEQGVNRAMSKQRGSGNALAALSKYNTGLASQDYGTQMDRLGRLQGQEQQYDIGNQQAENTRVGNANQFSLGQTQNENTRTNNLNQYELGSRRADQDFQLGQGQLARGNQSDYWNYDLGRERNANDAAQQRNNWNQRGRSSGGYGGNSFVVGSQSGRY